MAVDSERMRLERDLYRGLLALGASDDPRPFFEVALSRIVEATGARKGYLALYGGADVEREPPFFVARALDEDELVRVRGELSRGIVRESLSKGETISTASALDDPRFAGLESVGARGIRAVLCAPIGDAGTGVIYLTGRAAPGPFPEEDRRLLEDFARHVAPYATRLLAGDVADDPTAAIRARLPALESIAGRSAALASIFRQVELVAPLDVTVLLTGPSGSGKTALARVIHDSGPRRDRPFVELNCAAIPETLFESELFGAARGAHSTATEARAGKVEAADGGTLFLDEVGELPPAVQAKLLQFLQSQTYYRLGDSTPRSADVRLLAATNADLLTASQQRRFREDLYYRLAVMPLRVASLSERPEDVVPIAAACLRRAAERHRLAALPLSSGAAGALLATEWIGNVRQLANTIEAGLIRAHGAHPGDTAAELEAGHLFVDAADGDDEPTFHGRTRAFQLELLRQTLAATDWNVSEAARRLDLSRSRLNELLRGFGLSRPKNE